MIKIIVFVLIILSILFKSLCVNLVQKSLPCFKFIINQEKVTLLRPNSLYSRNYFSGLSQFQKAKFPLNASQNSKDKTFYLPCDELFNGMKYTQLGDSDLFVSSICLGTEVFGSKVMIDDDDVKEILDLAIDHYKINFIDVGEYDPIPFDSNTWGRGHAIIKEYFLKKPWKRKNVIVSARICSSRLREESRGWYLKWIRNSMNPPRLSKEEVFEAVDGLLNRLGIDYIDILSFDQPDRYVPNSQYKSEDTYCWGHERNDAVAVEEQLEILAELQQCGKVKYIGLSNETPWGVFKWVQLAKTMGLSKVICTHHMYNLLHRNEFESSGLPEIVHKKNLNVGVLAYGVLGGGILSAKYLDPERYNYRGPDYTLQTDEIDGPLSCQEGRSSEDWGMLSFGPGTGRANKFPEFYANHRSIWCQWKLGEIVKIARTFGMTSSELALAWTYSRSFITSTVIGPRTIGQLKECVRALNYPVTRDLERTIHEVFLRYRAPTMGCAYVASRLEDEDPLPQHDYLRYARGPITSGGIYWADHSQPNIIKKILHQSKKDFSEQLKHMAGYYDDPTDDNWLNFRMWKERTEEGLYGEYFAVKEGKLFGWEKKTLDHFEWRNTTKKEYEFLQTNDFHFVWKGGKVYKENTTQAMENFYHNRVLVLRFLYRHYKKHEQLIMNKDKIVGPNSEFLLYKKLDFDLIYKCLHKYQIDFLDESLLSSLEDYKNDLTPFESFTERFWRMDKFMIANLDSLSRSGEASHYE